MRLDHEIFQGPLEVELTLEEIETPANYRDWIEGRDLPGTLEAWTVQERDFPDIDVGLVSDPYGFEEAPDTEWISGGVNSKGPLSVALGRHGNYFFWGFFADPSDLTESAQRVFVNTIHYMRQFDGQAPLVNRTSTSRDWALVYAGYVRNLQGEDASEFLHGLFPADLIDEVGLDADRLEAYYRENLEYLRPPANGSAYSVDEDLQSLGVSNRRPELLDLVATRLAEDSGDELAHELIRRYVDSAGMTAPEFSRWLEDNRPYLFFSDLGGYRWHVDARARDRAARSAEAREH